MALLLLVSSWASGAPFYILDGRLGVPFDSLPPSEDILYVTTLDSAEAVFIYGERASEGAVVVQTKEYAARQHYHPPQQPVKQPTEEEIRKAKEEYRRERYLERREKRRKRKAIILLLTLLFIGADTLIEQSKAKKKKPMTDDEFRTATADMPQPQMPECTTLDPLFAQAAIYVVGSRHATIGDLQRFFGIDYSRALTLIRQLEDKQVIGLADRNDHHEIFYDSMQDLSDLFEDMGVKWQADQQQNQDS